MGGGIAFGLGVRALGLGDEGLAAELDLAALLVDADALDHDLLAFAHLVGGVGHAMVGQLADVQQAVQAGRMVTKAPNSTTLATLPR